MSGDCPICNEHALECTCPIIRDRKWISKEEAKDMFPYYGSVVYLNGPIICKHCEKHPIDCECLHGDK
jgi:hypothetical protein